ncbi:MAG: hypothetical protein AAF196_01725, partial [Planctomycetota bacterium]
MNVRIPTIFTQAVCLVFLAGCGSAPKKPVFDPVDPALDPIENGDGRRAVDQILSSQAPGPASPARLRLPSGVRLGVDRSVGEWADIRWTFPHHEPTPKMLGVARLTARLLIDSPLRDSTAPSLRRQIDSLGGRVETTVTSFATEIDLRVPAQRWRTAMLVLTQALETVPTSNIRAEQYAQQESRELTRGWLDDPLKGLIDRVRTFEQRPVAEWVDASESASLLQAQAFHGREYTARGSILVARLPGGVSALEQLAASIGDWSNRNPGTPRPPGAGRLSPEGLFWAPARAPGGVSAESSATTPEGFAEVAWVLELLQL